MGTGQDGKRIGSGWILDDFWMDFGWILDSSWLHIQGFSIKPLPIFTYLLKTLQNGAEDF
jgi:hypothetical protein